MEHSKTMKKFCINLCFLNEMAIGSKGLVFLLKSLSNDLRVSLQNDRLKVKLLVKKDSSPCCQSLHICQGLESVIFSDKDATTQPALSLIIAPIPASLVSLKTAPSYFTFRMEAGGGDQDTADV